VAVYRLFAFSDELDSNVVMRQIQSTAIGETQHPVTPTGATLDE